MASRKVLRVEQGADTRSNGLGLKYGRYHYFHLSCGHVETRDSDCKRWIAGKLVSPKSMKCSQCVAGGQDE